MLRPMWICLSLLLCTCASADIVLTESGKPNAVIVVSGASSELSKRAATELQSFIERISGAKLEIVSETATPSRPRIFIGSCDALRSHGIEIPSGYTPNMNEEGYIIKTIGNDLFLAGNEDGPYKGTLFAVYDLLDRLGCRWFFPGGYGEVIPALDTISIPELNVNERPDFRFRNIWYSGWMPVSDVDSANYPVWLERNRMTSLSNLSLPGDGSITRLAPAEQYFQSHPHIFAVNDKGEREKDMLCLSEPETVSIAVKTITEAFRADPMMYSFGFAPPDGHPRCLCDRCKAAEPGFMGKGFGDPSLSDTWFKFANTVAKEVYKEFPDRWLFTNGYANRVRPPEGVGPLSPNLGIQSAMLATCTLHPIGSERCWQRQIYKGVLDRWTRDLNCVFIYDYDPGKSLDNLPFPMLHNLEPDFKYFKERGVWGFWTEGQNCWMTTHLNYYVRARLMWDADADVQALVRDYCEKFYGAAADAIEDYIWTLEGAVASTEMHSKWGRLMHWEFVLTPPVMKKLDAAVERAVAKAASDSDRAHTHVIAKVHEYTRLFVDMENTAAQGDFAGAAARADKMLAIRDELAKVDPALLPHTPEWCRESQGSIEWCKKYYRDLAERTNGARGTLVALLPVTWEFKKDPEDIGTIYEWYLPGLGGDWESINSTLYWDLQGHQDKRGWAYGGKAWYRTTIEVPAVAPGKTIQLTFPGIYNTGLWVWVNGLLVDHRPRHDTRTPLDIDVTAHIQPGAPNTIAVLVQTLTPDRTPRGGLYRRAFLWTPES